MTELEQLLFYFSTIALYPGQGKDVKRLSRMVEHSRSSDADWLIAFVSALLDLDNAIVAGVNSGQFVYTNPKLSKKPFSVVPLFLYGLLTLVFDDEGLLRENWCRTSFATITEGLRLVRRLKDPRASKHAADVGSQKFILQQENHAPIDRGIAALMSYGWLLIEELMPTNAVLGFPGPGVTLDMERDGPLKTHPWVPQMIFADMTSIPDKFPHAKQHITSAYLNWLPHACWNESRFLTIKRRRKFPFVYLERQKKQPFGSHKYERWYEYQAPSKRVAHLELVPKTVLESRAITITDTFSVCAGATGRNSIMSCIEQLGLKDICNIHRQYLSGLSIFQFFEEIAATDVKGGTSCLYVLFLQMVLSKAPTVREIWNMTRPRQFTYNKATYNLNVLTMGDAMSVAIGTYTLMLVNALAAFATRYPERFKALYNAALKGSVVEDQARRMYADAFQIMTVDRKGQYHVVVDDQLFPRDELPAVEEIHAAIGVVINTRKSSAPLHNHIESCGTWYIAGNNGKPFRILPYRAPEYSNDKLECISSAQHFIQRAYRFGAYEFRALTQSIAYTFKLEEDLLLYESYVDNIVGSPLGVLTPTHTLVERRGKCEPLSDDDCYFYKFSPEFGLCPRTSRRPVRSYITRRKLPRDKYSFCFRDRGHTRDLLRDAKRVQDPNAASCNGSYTINREASELKRDYLSILRALHKSDSHKILRSSDSCD